MDLSIVIPAYNEQARLPLTLTSLLVYLKEQSYTFEVIVVDDGSKDKTADVVREFSKLHPQVRLIRLPRNYGKGHAVRTGMLSAQGEISLFADADGSTPWEEIPKLITPIKQEGIGLAFGSRALAETAEQIEARPHRKIIGRIFNALVLLFAVPGVRDTQCGFKACSRAVAEKLYAAMKINRFAFDVELIYLAWKHNIPFREIAVRWHHMPGSKVNLITDSLSMLKDIIKIKFLHARSATTLPPP